MSRRRLGEYNAREHWTVYILATGANLSLSIALYVAARAGVLAQLPITGSTGQFVSAYGISWGFTLDFLWTLFVFQGLLAVLVASLAGTTLVGRGWRWLYVFLALTISGFVGYWLGARFLATLNWISLLQNSGIDGSSVYSSLFWYGLIATVFYVAMMLVLRRSYDRLMAARNTLTSSTVMIENSP
jgi:hypothetical protein